MLKTMTVRATIAAVLAGLSMSAHAIADSPKRVDIPAGELRQALLQLSEQFGTDLVYSPEQIQGIQTRGAHGELTTEQAVTKLLEGTPLELRTDPSGAMLIVAPAAAKEAPQASTHSERPKSFWFPLRLAQSDTPAPSRGGAATPQTRVELKEDVVKGIPEVLVKGSRVLNMDIRRTRDDVQPYVVFERETIEHSGATNIEDFLKNRLTMSSTASTASQVASTSGSRSAVNLRGLGVNQTLILIDGHRLASSSAFGNTPTQTDLNAIPLSAIDRIEVLPTTSSGIYGGSATGGVVNVILRRDYEGAEVKVGYDNTFESDAAIRRIDMGAGMNLEGGRTTLMFAGSYSDQNPLTVGERDFFYRGRLKVLANNPGSTLPIGAIRPDPPLGARPNIRSVNGSPLFGPGTASYTTVPVGYTTSMGLAPLQPLAGTYNYDLPDGAQAAFGADRGMTTNPTVMAGMLTLRRKFTSNIDAFLDLNASRTHSKILTAAAPNSYTVQPGVNNPFGQAIRITLPGFGTEAEHSQISVNQRVLGGIIAQLPHAWSLGVDYTWDRMRVDWASAVAFLPSLTTDIGNNTLNVVRDTQSFPLDFSNYYTRPQGLLSPQHLVARNATLRLAGPIWSLSGGDIKLSTLLERRDEKIDDTVQFSGATTSFFYPSRSQEVSSAYAELSVPLFSESNRRPGLEDLQLQLAVRHDRYTTNGAVGFVASATPVPVDRARNEIESTDPTVGLRYKPIQDVMLRVSYGTGFVPPSVAQLSKGPGAPLADAALRDPKRGNQPLGTINVATGGNPDLTPEESESISIGTVLTPRMLPALRLSVDYSRIRKTDNIATPLRQVLLDNEDLLGRVTRSPTNLPGDLPGWAGPVIALDQSSVNLSSAEVEAYDVALDYVWDFAQAGNLSLYLGSTWTTHYKTQIAPTTAEVENAGVTVFNPLKFKANGGLTWKAQAWTVGWMTQYFDSYLVADPTVSSSVATFLSQGGRVVEDQIYHDVFVSYEFPAHRRAWSSMLEGLEVKLGIGNVFNSKPPFDAAAAFNGYYANHGDPRLRTYSLTAGITF